MVYRAKNKKQSKNHHVFLFIILALIVCAVVVVALLTLKPLGGNKTTNNGQGTNNTSSSTDQKSDSSGTKEESNEENNSTEPTPEAEKNNTQYEGENPNSLEELTGAVSFAGKSAGAFVVNIVIDQALGNSGRCRFNLVGESGESLSGVSMTESGPTASFCTYSTPLSNSISGKWNITVTVEAEGKAGIITGEVSI